MSPLAHKNNGKGCERMPHLVYWYGIERGSCDAYSLIEGKLYALVEYGTCYSFRVIFIERAILCGFIPPISC